MSWVDDYDEFNEEGFYLVEDQYPVPEPVPDLMEALRLRLEELSRERHAKRG